MSVRDRMRFKPVSGPASDGALHPDHATNIKTAEVFIKNIEKSLKPGMSVRVSGETAVEIAFKPPFDVPMGATAVPIALNQNSEDFGRLLESGINSTMEIAVRCFSRLQNIPTSTASINAGPATPKSMKNELIEDSF